MPRQEVPIVGGFGKDVDLHLSAQDTLNWLPVRSESPGSRSQFMLRQPPGLRPLTQIGTGPIRGVHTVEGRLYAVSGTQLYEVTSSYVGIPRGTIPGVGRVSMAHNQRGTGNELAVDNGAARYVLNTGTLAFQKVTDPGFPGSFIAFYVDQYLGYVEPQGRYWGHSDLADALEYSTLDQYEAEGDPDRIVSAYVSHREVLIFGKETTEPFVNTGSSTGTFERASNTVIENGCAARYGVAGMDNSVFWPDDKRILRRLDGYSAIRISTASEEAMLAECTDSEIKRAYAFTWEDRGHKVYYLTVPGKFTLGYDLLSGQFHRRSSPGLNTWRINSLTFWNGQWVGGDMQDGSLYALDWDYFYDGQEELVRERVTGALSKDQARMLVSEVELLFGTGGPASEIGEFVAQPEGPSITGNAPTGYVGDVYSFTYTLADGTPPYAVALAPLSDPLPAGLSLSVAGVLSGTPTTVESASFTVRVTDTLGLYDDLADTVAVEAGIAAPTMTTNTDSFTGLPGALTVGAAFSSPAGSGARVVRVSPDGRYAAYSSRGDVGAGKFGIRKWNPATGAWDNLSNPSDMPTAGPYDMAWSNDGLYLACGVFDSNPNNLIIYRRTGNSFAKVAQSVLPPNNGYFVAWSATGSMLAIGNGSSAAGVYVYDVTAGVLSNGRAGNAGTAGLRPAFSPDGGHVACGSSTSGLFVFSIGASSLTLADSDATQDAWSLAGVHWNDDGIVTVANQGAPGSNFVNTWTFAASTLTLSANAASQPPTAPIDSDITADGRYVVTAGGGANAYVYDLANIAAPSLVETQPVTLETVTWGDV